METTILQNFDNNAGQVKIVMETSSSK